MTSSEDYRLLVESIVDYGVFLLDKAGHVASWNPGAQRIKGYAAHEIIGEHFSKFYPREDVEAGKPERELEVAAAEGRLEDEGWRVRKDGSLFWANVVITALRDPTGKLRGFAKVTRDLTQRRAAEEQLRRSEERFRLLVLEVIFEAVGDAIMVQDRAGKVIFANGAAAKMCGFDSVADFLRADAPDILQRFEMLDEQGRVVATDSLPSRKVLTGSVASATAQLLVRNRQTGRQSWNVVRASAVAGPDGQPELAVIFWHDVTSERRREESERYLARATAALSSSLDYEAMLAMLADLLVPGLADWCSIQLLEGRGEHEGELKPVAVAHVDAAKLAMAREYQKRYPPDSAQARGVWNVVRTGQPELYEDISDELLTKVAQDAEHLELLRSVGMKSLIAVPIRVRDRVSGAITLVSAEGARRYDRQDVALAEELARRAGTCIENAKLYAQAQAAAARAEEASRVKDEFLATVSHELRTPLNAILGWASMLDDRTPDTTTAKGIAVIHRNARAQAKLVDDILDVSRIITGKLRLELQPVDIARIVRDAIEVVRPSALAKTITVDFEAPPEPCLLVADPERLQQVVWNLLSNAVKFTEAGGTVTVRIERDGARVELSVADTGRGIAPEFLPFVFDRFKQADGTTTRRVGGLGLGLAIVRHIVELHGGQVRAVSEGPGKGATFFVTLPVRAVRPSEGAARPSLRADAPSSTPPLPSLQGVRVLVVDDEPDARELLQTVLELAGAVVTTAATAAQGLELFERLPPDVLISDLGMPDEDGFEFMRRVRALAPQSGAAVPSIALSAYTRGEDKTKALAAGFTAHIGKPVSPQDLVAAVAKLAQRAP